MNTKDFKRLVLISISLFIAAGYATFTAENNLPAELAEYVASQYEADLSLADWGIAVAALLIVPANIGIYFLANWARHIFTAGIFITSAGMLFMEPAVYSPLESALYELGMLIDGIIIGVMYFTDIRHEFSKSST